MDVNSKGYQLAACLQAIEDVEKERAEKKEELLSGFRERLSTLRIEARKLQHDILAGQDNLPIEPPPAELFPSDPPVDGKSAGAN